MRDRCDDRYNSRRFSDDAFPSVRRQVRAAFDGTRRHRDREGCGRSIDLACSRMLTCGIKDVGNTPTASCPQWHTPLGHTSQKVEHRPIIAKKCAALSMAEAALPFSVR